MTTQPIIEYKRALSDPLPRAVVAARAGGQHQSPTPREARQPSHTFGWCASCNMPSLDRLCVACKQTPAPTAPTQSDIEMGPLPEVDPEPLPAAWANFRPDMSCYVDAPVTADAIDYPALTWAIQQGKHSVNSQYWRSEYVGKMEPTTQGNIMDWMRDRGGVSRHHWSCRLTTDTYDLSIVCMGSVTTIELIDYCVAPQAPAQRTYIVAEQQCGGVA